MYVPNSFAEQDPETLAAFIAAHPLATLVTSVAGEGLFGTHLPLVYDRARGPRGTLVGHVARANPHGRLAAHPVDALVIFTGPDAYITPSWYPSKHAHGRAVPTWNYIAVHVYGSLRLVDDEKWMRHHLEDITTRHEASQAHPWHVHDAPAEYVNQQMQAIVGLEIAVDRLEGKWKMSQNRSAADVDGVIHGLGERETAQSAEVAALVAAQRSRQK